MDTIKNGYHVGGDRYWHFGAKILSLDASIHETKHAPSFQEIACTKRENMTHKDMYILIHVISGP